MSVLDLKAFEAAPLYREPFEYLVLPGFVQAASRLAINEHFPVVAKPGSFPLSDVTYGPAFAKLIEELRGEAVRRAFEKKFRIGLEGRPTMFTVRGQSGEKDGHIHTDSLSKIITVLIYLNPRWEGSGGRLRLLRSATNIEDVILEVPPEEGTLIAFKRSDNSFHGHKPFIGPRRVIQMNWVADEGVVRYETRRHHFSALIKKILRRAS